MLWMMMYHSHEGEASISARIMIDRMIEVWQDAAFWRQTSGFVHCDLVLYVGIGQ